MSEEFWYAAEVLAALAGVLTMVLLAFQNYRRDQATDRAVENLDRRVENLEGADPDVDLVTRIARMEVTLELALARLQDQVDRLEADIK